MSSLGSITPAAPASSTRPIRIRASDSTRTTVGTPYAAPTGTVALTCSSPPPPDGSVSAPATPSTSRGHDAPATATESPSPPGPTCSPRSGPAPPAHDTGTPSAAPTTATSATTTSATTTPGTVPTDVLDLRNWYLTLPTGADGDPDTVVQPDLATYTSPYFQLTDAHDGVVFTAPVDGVTTKNSHYPRSELREMNGPDKAAWSNTTGVHTLTLTEAVTHLPDAKPEAVAAQIHDTADDVLQIRLEGSHLLARYDDGNQQVELDPHYTLGTPYTLTIVAADGQVHISYNDTTTVDLPLSGTGWYFKAGAYVQSNTSTGDQPPVGFQKSAPSL